jgi:hypothetical protein
LASKNQVSIKEFPAACFQNFLLCALKFPVYVSIPFVIHAVVLLQKFRLKNYLYFQKFRLTTTFGLISNGCSASSWHDSMQEIPAFKLPVL